MKINIILFHINLIKVKKKFKNRKNISNQQLTRSNRNILSLKVQDAIVNEVVELPGKETGVAP